MGVGWLEVGVRWVQGLECGLGAKVGVVWFRVFVLSGGCRVG